MDEFSNTTDGFDLQRFIAAQQAVYKNVLAELGSGQKNTHWIWFVFPRSLDLAIAQWRSIFQFIHGKRRSHISQRLYWARAFSNAPDWY